MQQIFLATSRISIRAVPTRTVNISPAGSHSSVTPANVLFFRTPVALQATLSRRSFRILSITAAPAVAVFLYTSTAVITMPTATASSPSTTLVPPEAAKVCARLVRHLPAQCSRDFDEGRLWFVMALADKGNECIHFCWDFPLMF
jgi:hypothetical protein